MKEKCVQKHNAFFTKIGDFILYSSVKLIRCKNMCLAKNISERYRYFPCRSEVLLKKMTVIIREGQCSPPKPYGMPFHSNCLTETIFSEQKS